MKNKEANEIVTLIGDNGQKIICDILFTYYSEQFDKHYVVFVPQGTDECSAGVYTEKHDGSFDVSDIKSEEEWTMLEGVLDEYYDSMDEKEKNK